MWKVFNITWVWGKINECGEKSTEIFNMGKDQQIWENWSVIAEKIA